MHWAVVQPGLLLSLLTLAMLPCSGCGGGHDATVQGTVTLDGKPLTSGGVQFHPVAEGATAYGTLGEGGAYQLTTGSAEGIEPGEYKVTVMAYGPPPANLPPNSTPPILPPITPQKYADTKTTPLTYNVTAGGNQIDLALVSK